MSTVAVHNVHDCCCIREANARGGFDSDDAWTPSDLEVHADSFDLGDAVEDVFRPAEQR